MAKITEDYVSFEIAKLLKEKGFDQNCATYYLDGHVWRHYHCEVIPKSKQIYAAPTQAMAMKWLREVHHYIIEIHYGNVGSPREPEMQWWWELENEQGQFLEGNITDRNTTYEQACEAAVKHCLENLI